MPKTPELKKKFNTSFTSEKRAQFLKALAKPTNVIFEDHIAAEVISYLVVFQGFMFVCILEYNDNDMFFQTFPAADKAEQFYTSLVAFLQEK